MAKNSQKRRKLQNPEKMSQKNTTASIFGNSKK